MSADLDDIAFRSARPDEVSRILAFWEDAAENDARPRDEATRPRSPCPADPDVREQNGLGRSFWSAAGFVSQPEWRRWVRSTDR